MSLNSNIQELIDKLEGLKDMVATDENKNVPPSFSDALHSGMNACKGLMTQRIFNAGEDAENKSLGVYIGPKVKARGSKDDERLTVYERYRSKKGRQIGYKDLEMEGSLRRSIIVAYDGKIEIVIDNEESALIAAGQERQIGNIRAGQNANSGVAEPAAIFAPSQEEYDFFVAEGSEAIKQIFKMLLDDI